MSRDPECLRAPRGIFHGCLIGLCVWACILWLVLR